MLAGRKRKLLKALVDENLFSEQNMHGIRIDFNYAINSIAFYLHLILCNLNTVIFRFLVIICCITLPEKVLKKNVKNNSCWHYMRNCNLN